MESLEEYVDSFPIQPKYKVKVLRAAISTLEGNILFVTPAAVKDICSIYSPKEIEEVYDMYRLLEL